MSELQIASADITAKAQMIEQEATKLTAKVKDLDIDGFFGEETMWNQLDTLARTIDSQLNKLGRRPRK